jgi:hypothetical protein
MTGADHYICAMPEEARIQPSTAVASEALREPADDWLIICAWSQNQMEELKSGFDLNATQSSPRAWALLEEQARITRQPIGHLMVAQVAKVTDQLTEASDALGHLIYNSCVGGVHGQVTVKSGEDSYFSVTLSTAYKAVLETPDRELLAGSFSSAEALREAREQLRTIAGGLRDPEDRNPLFSREGLEQWSSVLDRAMEPLTTALNNYRRVDLQFTPVSAAEAATNDMALIRSSARETFREAREAMAPYLPPAKETRPAAARVAA